MKYSVITFGCRVNQADSLGFEEKLLAAGAESVAAHTAEVVIVNTCSVTATADQGARQTIRRIARDNPSARIVVTMGMPALVYRWYFGAHGLKSLERSILGFCGIGPCRESLFGMVETASPAKRARWIAGMRKFGAAGH